jgi:hypothetical protein
MIGAESQLLVVVSVHCAFWAPRREEAVAGERTDHPALDAWHLVEQIAMPKGDHGAEHDL